MAFLRPADGRYHSGQYIGLDVTGRPFGNGGDGIRLLDSGLMTIGGTTAGARNVISGNTGDGVDISGSGSTGNVVEGNFIGVNAAGTAALGNANGVGTFSGGVVIESGASDNTIGGTTPGARNVISGNAFAGVFLNGVSANVVQGNFIGTDVTGASR